MFRARVHRPSRAGLISALVAFALLLTPSVAKADPSVADLEKQIAAIWDEAEPLIEQYNAIHEQYKKNLAKQAALQKQIEPLQRQVELGQVRGRCARGPGLQGRPGRRVQRHPGQRIARPPWPTS